MTVENDSVEKLKELLSMPAPRLDGVAVDMVHHIAAGIEDPADIAARYGFDDQAWEQLQNNQAFQVAVKKVAADYEHDGTTFKNKSKLVASDLLEHFYKLVKTNELSPGQAMKFFELVVRLGGLEPKNEPVVADTGAKFSISINMPTESARPTIDVTTIEQDHE